MSAPTSEQMGTGNSSRTENQARDQEADRSADEPSLVRLYLELTGGTESQARGVFMFLSREPDETK